MIQGPSLWGLIPLLVFIILVFKKWNPIAAIVGATIVGAIMSGQTPVTIAASIKDGTGSFMAYVGLIIMAGGGLGKITEKTGVAGNIVNFVMKKIGINSENKAIIGTMVASVLLVGFLGTLAGANALIAPVVIPIVAAAGLSPAVVATIFQGAGATGLFLGPFTPPMVTLMELTGLTYFQVLISVSIPISILLWVTTFIYCKRILPRTLKESPYTDADMVSLEHDSDLTVEEKLKGEKIGRQSTFVFLLTLVGLLIYGVIIEGGSTFAIFIIMTTAITTGLAGRLSPSEIADTFADGAKPLVWLFFQFVLFTPFMDFIEDMGAFEAMANLLLPYIETGGVGMLGILATLIGVVGVPGAAVAQSIVLDEMFAPMVIQTQIPMTLWVAVLLVGSQITSFLYPTGDTLGAMGVARSDDIKNMVIFGVVATLPPILYVVIRSILMM